MKREERIERIKEKHANRAERAEREATERFAYVDAMAGCMNGTPVLVGHHSEKGHRRDLERMDTAMRKGVEAGRAARESRRAVASAERAGISIEDDDAASLLRAKIEKLEEKQRLFRAVNRIIRKKPRSESTPEKLEKLAALGILGHAAPKLFTPDFAGRVGIPSYELTNNNANIKRCKGRLIELERLAEIPDGKVIAAGVCEGKAFRFITDTEDKRLRFESDRLSKEATKHLKQNGFKWSRNRSAWVRLLNQAAINAAVHWIHPKLEDRTANEILDGYGLAHRQVGTDRHEITWGDKVVFTGSLPKIMSWLFEKEREAAR